MLVYNLLKLSILRLIQSHSQFSLPPVVMPHNWSFSSLYLIGLDGSRCATKKQSKCLVKLEDVICVCLPLSTKLINVCDNKIKKNARIGHCWVEAFSLFSLLVENVLSTLRNFNSL